MKDGKYGYINALKGLAILAVTMVHAGGGYLPGIFGRIGNDGARGVQLFFILSGMLAFGSLERFCGSGRKMTVKTAMRWYGKKLLRLLPLYYLALLISMLTGSWSPHWLGTEGRVTIGNLLAHILMLHGFFPHYTDSVLWIEWYLGCLWIFYLVTPILFRYIDSLEKSLVFGVAAYIVMPWMNTVLSVLLPIDDDPHIYCTYLSTFGPPSQFLVYVFGVILYFAVKRIRETKVERPAILSYALLILALIALYGQVNGAASLYRLSRHEMFGLWFSLIVLSQALHSCRIIDNRFFGIIGEYSYGIYLFQFIWLLFYDRYIRYTGRFDWTVKYLVSVAALFAIAFLLSRFYERPVVRMLEGLFRKHGDGAGKT